MFIILMGPRHRGLLPHRARHDRRAEEGADLSSSASGAVEAFLHGSPRPGPGPSLQPTGSARARLMVRIFAALCCHVVLCLAVKLDESGSMDPAGTGFALGSWSWRTSGSKMPESMQAPCRGTSLQFFVSGL